MGRRKAAQNADIRPWLSARRDCSEGRFIQVGNSLLLSHKADGIEVNRFLKLSLGARFVYLCMCMESGGKRSFQFPQTAAKKYGIASRTLRRSIEELTSKGFIKTQSGKTARLPNNYEFSSEWKTAF